MRPEVVAEIAFNEIQVSPQYPGGVALRFARVKRYRDDKRAAEADTFATIQAMYQQLTASLAPVVIGFAALRGQTTSTCHGARRL